MSDDRTARIEAALERRFGDAAATPALERGGETLAGMAARGSCRAFRPDPVDSGLLRLLAAVALSAPSKSDLQQRDIVLLEDPEQRRALHAVAEAGAWAETAPAFLVVCANNRRQRQLHDWRGRPFANDHVDALFNAAVDAGVALAALATAAEAVGLGCCPISQVRNQAQAVSDLLSLPDHVFPVAGLALGWPEAEAPEISPRLPLAATLHVDRFDETGLRAAVDAYDRRRAAVQPYAAQRFAEAYGGEAPDYGWSEDKARQYARPERADFGAFLRRKGFDFS